MSFTDQFGFLNYPNEIRFDGGWIKPRAEFSEGLEYVGAIQHEDGFIYPPQIQTYRGSFDEPDKGTPVPNTVRPAQVFSLPLSHDLYLENSTGGVDVRHTDAGLIVHLAAFFFGTRLQFKGWQFDGRVPIKPTNSFSYAGDVPQHFISWVYKKWRTWSPELRIRYINILYMHGRADSCLWDWERFVARYMVFDAIYRFHVEAGGAPIKGHDKRLRGICEAYGAPVEPDVIQAIYRLRNDLFHEALWAGRTPGSSGGGAFRKEQWLGRLNAQLIVAVAGYANDLVRQGWWFYGWRSFSKFDAHL